MSLDPRTPVDDMQRLARELSRINDRLRRLESPTGTQTFRTVDLLSDLGTYSDTAGTALVTAGGAGFDDYSPTPSVTFTLSRDLSVLVSAVMPYELSVNTAGAFASVSALFEIAGGADVLEIEEYIRTGTFIEQRRAAYGAAPVDLAAGTYTIQAAGATVNLSGTAAGVDRVEGFPITLSVAVLGVA